MLDTRPRQRPGSFGEHTRTEYLVLAARIDERGAARDRGPEPSARHGRGACLTHRRDAATISGSRCGTRVPALPEGESGRRPREGRRDGRPARAVTESAKSPCFSALARTSAETPHLGATHVVAQWWKLRDVESVRCLALSDVGAARCQGCRCRAARCRNPSSALARPHVAIAQCCTVKGCTVKACTVKGAP